MKEQALENRTPYTASRSRRRYRGRVSQGKRLHELLGCPLSCGGVGDVDVDEASSIVRQDDEDEQHLERHGEHDGEVYGDEAPTWLSRKVRQVCDGGAL